MSLIHNVLGSLQIVSNFLPTASPIVLIADWLPDLTPKVAVPTQTRPTRVTTAATATRRTFLPCFLRGPWCILRSGPVGGPYSKPYCIITRLSCLFMEGDGEVCEEGTLGFSHSELFPSHAWFNRRGVASPRWYFAKCFCHPFNCCSPSFSISLERPVSVPHTRFNLLVSRHNATMREKPVNFKGCGSVVIINHWNSTVHPCFMLVNAGKVDYPTFDIKVPQKCCIPHWVITTSKILTWGDRGRRAHHNWASVRRLFGILIFRMQ